MEWQVTSRQSSRVPNDNLGVTEFKDINYLFMKVKVCTKKKPMFNEMAAIPIYINHARSEITLSTQVAPI